MNKRKGYAIVTLYKGDGTAKVEVYNVISNEGCIQLLVRDGNADVIKKLQQEEFEKHLPELEPGWEMIGFIIKMCNEGVV